MTKNTIIALASGRGAAGVAVLRLSGQQSGDVLERLTGNALPSPRFATLYPLYNPKDAVLLDKALCLYFKAPNSFTGEDVVELHVHGGRAVIDSVMSACLLCEDVRLAEPGEFSKRAFLNGRMDLTEAEAIADLVSAETTLQAQQALSQMRGDLRDLYNEWAIELTRSLAYIEADIDFTDEEIPESLSEKMRPVLQKIETKIAHHLDDNNIGERLRDGISVAIIGAPNAGKSSLMNALAKRDVAIVTDIAGTTRDVLEVHLNIAGYPVILLDTAGLRDSNDVIEQQGVDRARSRAASADLKLALFAAAADIDPEIKSLIDDKTICVVSKSDLGALDIKNAISLSTKTGEGIDQLLNALEKRLKDLFDVSRETIYLTRKRHRSALEEAAEHLKRALNPEQTPELIAEDVRLSVRAIGRIMGQVDVEDLLDIIFRDFCIGK